MTGTSIPPTGSSTSPVTWRRKKLQELLDYAWRTFYHDEPQRMKMFKLMEQVMRREQADGTYRPRNRKLARQAFGKKI